MLDAGENMGWVARQVGHSSFKMIYEHYYKYMKDDRAGGKFMENYREKQKETPAKLSQNGHTLQGPNKNKCKISKLNGREDWIWTKFSPKLQYSGLVSFS